MALARGYEMAYHRLALVTFLRPFEVIDVPGKFRFFYPYMKFQDPHRSGCLVNMLFAKENKLFGQVFKSSKQINYLVRTT